jgi:hypothetical protein
VLINFSSENRTVTLPHSMRSLLDARDATSVDLPRYGVAVLFDHK